MKAAHRIVGGAAAAGAFEQIKRKEGRDQNSIKKGGGSVQSGRRRWWGVGYFESRIEPFWFRIDS